MANNVSLMSYLQQALPAIPANPPPTLGHNTVNSAYEGEDIHVITVWHGFNLHNIIQRYGNTLGQAHLPPDPMPTSPVRAITSENSLRSKISEYVIPRVRRGLRAGFNFLATMNQMNGLTKVSLDVGESAMVTERLKPDTAYFVLALPAGTSCNRAPDDIKPSWKWESGLALHPSPKMRMEYRQALSQVNWYMKQHHSRYGFLMTDRELVVFRRLDDDGNLELALPIPFTRGGTVVQTQLTVLLALWYLGMLAAQDQGVDHWYM
ncbi:hypothetical protein BJX63DRAFT_428762 [Aspergillus granulosus]|uniref:Uncharacterized protein n=1 Tax=Aspergillus granulosus TaxID=176169 RepID=A0ABR4HWL4_9EURO